MKLIDKKIKVDSILLDPFNPRFTNHDKLNQESIKDRILKSRDAKDLLQSMQVDIKWVNKIVVIRKEDALDVYTEIKGFELGEYIVVEGNTRVACLKSGRIDNITGETQIPVLIATLDDGESLESFWAEIRVTQGIANVMVVKEWSVVAKAKHLYVMYWDIINRDFKDSEFKPQEVYRVISDELGLKLTEVRRMITRYYFFKTINEISDEIPEDHWGYLEAFDRTKDIREKFGICNDTGEFDFDQEYVDEILKEIPSIIKIGVSEGINTKQFRDVISSKVNSMQSKEEIFEFTQEIVEKDGEFNFRSLLDEQKNSSEEESWSKYISSVNTKLDTFPVVSEWTKKYSNSFKITKDKVEKILRFIDEG